MASNDGAEEGTRTPTPLRAHGPEPCASASSATSAIEAVSVRRITRAAAMEGTTFGFYREANGTVKLVPGYSLSGEIRLHPPLCAHTAPRPQAGRPVATRDLLGPLVDFNALRVCPQAPRDMRQTQSALQSAAPVLSVLGAVGRRSRLRYCFSGGAEGGDSGRSIKGMTEPSMALIKR